MINRMQTFLGYGTAGSSAAFGFSTSGSSGINGSSGTSSAGEPIVSVYTASTSYLASTSDCVILCSASGITITLPAASENAGKIYYVKNIAASGSQILKTSGGQISGTSGTSGITVAATLNSSGSNLIVVSDGTNWHLLGTH